MLDVLGTLLLLLPFIRLAYLYQVIIDIRIFVKALPGCQIQTGSSNIFDINSRDAQERADGTPNHPSHKPCTRRLKEADFENGRRHLSIGFRSSLQDFGFG